MSEQPTPTPTEPTPAPQTGTQQADDNRSDRGGHVDQVITIRGRMR